MRIETYPSQPHRERRWWIDSAYEQSVLARAGSFGGKDTSPNLLLRQRDPATAHPLFRRHGHNISWSPRGPNDESTFLTDELAEGRLYADGSEIKLIEKGLRAIAGSVKMYRSVLPHNAEKFLQILDEQRAARAVDAALPVGGIILSETVETTPEIIEIQDMRSQAGNGKVIN